jgi:hypothetical protein
VDEERVVADAGLVRDRLAGGVGELAVGAHHEAGKCVGRVEAGGLDAAIECLAIERDGFSNRRFVGRTVGVPVVG